MVSRATVANYMLEFCKRSDDGSGKATIAGSVKNGTLVHGVMFDAERGELDKAEGLGQGYANV